MSDIYRYCSLLSLLTATSLGTVACSSFDAVSHKIASIAPLYSVTVVQGNFVSKEQVAALSPGMGRNQVKEVLGSPLVVSVFHENRWDYVFTIQRKDIEKQTRRLSVYFENDVLVRFEGDEMPSEAEFVDSLDAHRKDAKVPELMASEATLEKAQSKDAKKATNSEAPTDQTPIDPTNYPPLEP